MSGHQPARVYVVLQGAWAFLWALAFTLSLAYQVDVVGLSAFQLIVVGTVLEATCFLGEIPTGVVADVHSRKWSVVIGLVLIGGGICLITVPAFWPILVAQVVWGLGYTFVSGAAEAWVTDEIGDAAVQPVLTRAHQWSLGLKILGVLAAGGLGQLGLAVPIAVGGVGFVLLGLAMAAIMREEAFSPVPPAEREGWRGLWRTTTEGFAEASSDRVVRTFLVVALLAGLTSEVMDRLWADRVVNAIGLPAIDGGVATWFTLFALISAAIGLVASVVANKLAPAMLHAEHPTGVLAGLLLVQVIGVAVFALSGKLAVALSGKWIRDAAQSVSWPVSRAWLNRSVPNPARRATTLSLTGQADAVGQVVGGPSLGLVASRVGVQGALLTAAVLQAPSAVLYSRLRPRAEQA